MLEGIFHFLLGFLFARVLQPKLSADILLYWNQDSMGWRPLANKSEMRPNMRYLAAYEVEPERVLEADE